MLLTLALVACDGEQPVPAASRWVELTRGFRSRPLAEQATRLEATAQPPRHARVVQGGLAGEETWLEVPLPHADWSAGERPCEWRIKLPAGGAMFCTEKKRTVLSDGAGREWTYSRQVIGARKVATRFMIEGDEIVVCLEGEPSDAMLCRARLDSGKETDGHWRARQWDLTTKGILVFPREPERLACEIPPASRLCFSTVSPDPGGHGADLAPTIFRVKLGGRTLLEHRQSYQSPLRSAWHDLALDASGPQELVFEVDGPAPALFATPVLAPGARGSPGRRPWKEGRPDIVLILCDTFRADSLSAWGGAPEHAPQLNALVEGSLRFLDARATAAWTLPSIGTILSGLFPGQHGGTDLDRGVTSAAETLAEVLGRAGYRTAAVTDSMLFSSHFGQDQGFEWFEEVPVANWDLAATLARARQRVACDDGRPLFLVVHTYRVHPPMRWGPEEDGQPWADALQERSERRRERNQEGRVSAEPDAEFQAIGRRFYLNAVNDLDQKIGTWIGELERDGFFERGLLVLTSDHGDAFGENGQSGHGGDLFDVKLRVPLALRGRGIEPRAVRGVVSLIDLAPTLTDLADVDPAPSWPGRSLLTAAAGRPAFAFDLKKHNQQLALYAEGKKLMAPDVDALRAGRLTHAFDLTQDPGEAHDLARGTEWPRALAQALADPLELLLVPVSAAKDIDLPLDVQDDLEAIGYGE